MSRFFKNLGYGIAGILIGCMSVAALAEVAPGAIPPSVLLTMANTWRAVQSYTITGTAPANAISGSITDTLASSGAGTVRGLNLAPAIGATNVGNWTSSQSIVGAQLTPTIASGSNTYTVAGMSGLFVNMSMANAGTTLAVASSVRIAPMTCAGTCTNVNGVTIFSQTAGVNNTDLVLGGGGTCIGNYGICQNDSYQNFLNGSLAVAGCTIGANALCVTGAESISGNSVIGGTLQVTGTEIVSGNGSASVSNVLWNGTVFTGGTGTTNFPAMFVQPSGTTAATTWSTSGTGLGMNLASGFAGNFLDFKVAGGTSVFGVASTGGITLGGVTSSAAFTGTGNMVLSAAPTFTGTISGASLTLSSTLQVPTIKGGSAASSALVIESTSAVGTTDSIVLKTGSQVTAIGIDTNQLITVPRIASDAALTDTTVCQDTTNHGLRSGSGALGICLGTSSKQFKTDYGDFAGGIDDMMKLKLVTFRYIKGYGDNGAKRQGGLFAEDVYKIFPDCVGLNKEGKPLNLDGFCLYFHSLKAQQDQQKEILALSVRLKKLEYRHAQHN